MADDYPSVEFFQNQLIGLEYCSIRELEDRLAKVSREWSAANMVDQYADILRTNQSHAKIKLQLAIKRLSGDHEVVTNPERSFPMEAMTLPFIEDLSYADLHSERAQLEAGIKEAEALPGISKAVAVGALKARYERVGWAIQAFEKVTWRQLTQIGVKSPTHG